MSNPIAIQSIVMKNQKDNFFLHMLYEDLNTKNESFLTLDLRGMGIFKNNSPEYLYANTPGKFELLNLEETKLKIQEIASKITHPKTEVWDMTLIEMHVDATTISQRLQDSFHSFFEREQKMLESFKISGSEDIGPK